MALADISPIVSAIAIAVSPFTLWCTVLRRGTVRSTHPSFVVFRYDFVGKKVPQAKIFFRSLLFCTGKRGQVIESLFLRVREGSRHVEFSFWCHADKDLIRAAGCSFLKRGLPRTTTSIQWMPIHSFSSRKALTLLNLWPSFIGRERLVSLWNVTLEMPAGAFGSTIARETAVFYS